MTTATDELMIDLTDDRELHAAITRDLTAEQVDEIGRRLDAIRTDIESDLGEDDAAYIRRLIRSTRCHGSWTSITPSTYRSGP